MLAEVVADEALEGESLIESMGATGLLTTEAGTFKSFVDVIVSPSCCCG